MKNTQRIEAKKGFLWKVNSWARKLRTQKLSVPWQLQFYLGPLLLPPLLTFIWSCCFIEIPHLFLQKFKHDRLQKCLSNEPQVAMKALITTCSDIQWKLAVTKFVRIKYVRTYIVKLPWDSEKYFWVQPECILNSCSYWLHLFGHWYVDVKCYFELQYS